MAFSLFNIDVLSKGFRPWASHLRRIGRTSVDVATGRGAFS
jgi:hypothetical protein